MDHLGVEVETTDEVHDATTRLSELGLFTLVEDDTTCCFARQDKVWVQGPGREPWEVYTVIEDSAVYGSDGPAGRMAGRAGESGSCCGVSACCTAAEAPVEEGVGVDEAKSAAGCGCIISSA